MKKIASYTHLNTSYVDIKQQKQRIKLLQEEYLNTSYVDIKRKWIAFASIFCCI